ncbi:hypothetical protein PtA15_13A346 [Puccinia triticina]|uniref:Uncharacterized protein n=1 Tax=Puccinia triticina TaxID=208348 RepID=A0ABY7D0J1_9BASI|nr:uncharacterized protein PtA15_13A346 [Puccinia triticina]WAQ90946.1 hypothetical protein PtA15_13A346 [Puccinia triticina]
MLTPGGPVGGAGMNSAGRDGPDHPGDSISSLSRWIIRNFPIRSPTAKERLKTPRKVALLLSHHWLLQVVPPVSPSLFLSGAW